MDLRRFPDKRHAPWAEHLRHIGERRVNAVWRLKQDERGPHAADLLQRPPPSLLRPWREAQKEKTVNGQSGHAERRRNGAGSRDRDHGHVRRDGLRDEVKPGVGDGGHAGVGDQGDVLAGQEPADQLRRPFPLVVFVVGDQRRGDAVALQQGPGVPRVLAGDHVHLAEDAQRPQSDVFQVADRRPDDVERTHQGHSTARWCGGSKTRPVERGGVRNWTRRCTCPAPSSRRRSCSPYGRCGRS